MPQHQLTTAARSGTFWSGAKGAALAVNLNVEILSAISAVNGSCALTNVASTCRSPEAELVQGERGVGELPESALGDGDLRIVREDAENRDAGEAGDLVRVRSFRGAGA